VVTSPIEQACIGNIGGEDADIQSAIDKSDTDTSHFTSLLLEISYPITSSLAGRKTLGNERKRDIES